MTAKKVLIGSGLILILITLIGGFIALSGGLDKGGSRNLYIGTVGNYNLKLDRAPDPPVPDVPSRFTVSVQTKDGKPVDDAKVMIVPNMPGMPMPGMVDTAANHTSNGLYQTSVPVTMEGYWYFDVQVAENSFGSAQFRFEDPVAKPGTPWVLLGLLIAGVTIGAGLIFFGWRGNRPDDEDEEDDEDDQGDEDKPVSHQRETVDLGQRS